MNAVIWTKENCGFCKAAKQLLDKKSIPFKENFIGRTHTREDLLAVVPDAKTVPQVFIDDKLIGGYTDLRDFLK